MSPRPVVLAVCLLLISSARATEIYRWVDENGHTQLSDVVPDRYKDKAIRIDSAQFEPSAADKASAEARAKLLKTQAAIGLPVASAPAVSSQRAQPVTFDKSNCAAWQSAYTQSQECFAQFRNSNASVKAGGYKNCSEVPDPSTTCGVATSP